MVIVMITPPLPPSFVKKKLDFWLVFGDHEDFHVVFRFVLILVDTIIGIQVVSGTALLEIRKNTYRPQKSVQVVTRELVRDLSLRVWENFDFSDIFDYKIIGILNSIRSMDV